MNISDRILLVIEELGMSKTLFASTLNITPAYVSKIINKGAVPSDRLIEDICEKFDINENWLRFGEGEMFVQVSRSDAIATFAGSLMKDEEESFRRRLIESLAKLDDEGWRMLEKIATDVLKRD